jgi:hypothetical protein
VFHQNRQGALRHRAIADKYDTIPEFDHGPPPKKTRARTLSEITFADKRLVGIMPAHDALD